MATMPSVPLTYAGLADAIAAGAYPHERTWIEFKKRLFPEGADAADGSARARVREELAKDMASLAVQGGFLVYGVKEDKVKHLFTVDEMGLEVGRWAFTRQWKRLLTTGSHRRSPGHVFKPISMLLA